MKRLLLIFCAVLLVSVMLCGCGEEKVEAAAERVGDQAATIASELKDNVDSMIEDGTVKDGDGYIGEHERTTEPPSASDTMPTEDGTDGGMFDGDPLDIESTESGDNL